MTERLPWYHDDESLGSPISPLHSPTMDHKDSTMVDSVIRNEVGYMARSMFILHSFSLFPVCLFSSWGQTSLLIWTLHAMLRPNVPSQPSAICSMLTTHIAWGELVVWSENKSARHYGSSNNKVLKYCPFAKKYFTSEQLLGEHFHLELCKQHKTVLSHFMRQNLHGNRGHPLDRTKIGRASLRVVEDDPRVDPRLEEMTQVSVTFSSH